VPSFDYEKFRQLPLPTEGQITAKWHRPFELPVVSVVCLTYNQEAYIEDAIRGFLTQETEFPFEVIIHDDASTDGTQAVVCGYQRRYPNLIRAVFQQENQYSKGLKVGRIAAAAASGKYIALCEGDDFWIDRKKLAIQVQAFGENPGRNICFHRCVTSSPGSDSLKEKIRDIIFYPGRSAIVPAKVIAVGDGGYVPTASIMMVRSFYLDFPQWYDSCPVGDYFVQVLCSHPMGAIFVPQRMCFYREFAIGSWSSKTVTQTAGERLERSIRMKSYFELLDSYLSEDCSTELEEVYDLSVLNGIRTRACTALEKLASLELCWDSRGKRGLLFLLDRGFGESIVFRYALFSIYVLGKSRQYLKIFMSHTLRGREAIERREG